MTQFCHLEQTIFPESVFTNDKKKSYFKVTLGWTAPGGDFQEGQGKKMRKKREKMRKNTRENEDQKMKVGILNQSAI